MRLRYKIIIGLSVGLNVFLTNCYVGSSPSSTPVTPVTISPQPASLPVNSTTTFTAGGTGAESYTSWGFLGFVPTNSVGTLSVTRGQTTVYTAPPAPPIYAFQVDPSIQGKVRLQALVSGTGTSELDFFITAPFISTGISPALATVPPGGTAQFYAYAVGSTNNRLTFQVSGVTGGSTANGTINATGLYTAPANMPMTGNTVTITAVSTADPTKTATSTVTLR